MEAAGLAVGIAGLSPLASVFGKLSKFLYKAARDKGEIGEEMESFALIMKVARNSFFITSEKLKALPLSVQSSKTCRYLEKQGTLEDIQQAIRNMERGVTAIFPQLHGMKKHTSFRSKVRWLAKQKHRLFELTQNIVPLQSSFGLIMDVIELERDNSDKALTRDPVYRRRLDEDMGVLKTRLEVLEEQIAAMRKSQGRRHPPKAKASIFLSPSSVNSLVKLSSSMRFDGRVPEGSPRASDESSPRTSPGLTSSSTRVESTTKTRNSEQGERPRQSRFGKKSTFAGDTQRQQWKNRECTSSASVSATGSDSQQSLSVGGLSPRISLSPNELNGRQDATSSESTGQEESSCSSKILLDVENGTITCSSGQIRTFTLSLSFPSAGKGTVSVAGKLCSAMLGNYMSQGTAQKYDIRILEVTETKLIDSHIRPKLRADVLGITEPLHVRETGKGLRSKVIVQFFVLKSYRYYVVVGSAFAARQN